MSTSAVLERPTSRHSRARLTVIPNVGKKQADRGLKRSKAPAASPSRVREILDNDDVQIVTCGTPQPPGNAMNRDLGHASGQDVYIEKPISTCSRGPSDRRSGEKSKRMFQTGTQCRSKPRVP